MAIDVGTAQGHLDLDISGFLSGLKTAQSEATSTFTNVETKAGGSMTSIGSKLQTAGALYSLTVTTPLVALGKKVYDVATDFEYGMSQVQAISGATGDEFTALREKAIELGADTAFSSGEVADAMTEMAKAGWSSQQILDGMGGVLDAAAASGTDLATVATICADAISGFGLEASESTRVADLLTQAANAGTIDVTDLGESFKYISPVARSMGFSIEDVTTALTAMSMSGIKGSQAGTSLRTMFTRMVKPTDAVADAMDQLGISLTDGAGNFKSMDTILAEMRTSFSGLTDEQKTYYAATLAGQEGMSGLLSILNMTQEEYDAISDSMNNASGTAQETAAVMQDNLQSKVEQLGGAFESLCIRLGDVFVPILTDLVVKAIEFVDWLGSLDKGTLEWALKIAVLVAALGPLMTGLGTVLKVGGNLLSFIGNFGSTVSTFSSTITGVVNSFKNIGEAVTLARAGFTGFASETSLLGTAIGSITAPIAAVIAVIAVLVAAFATLWATNEEFRNKMIEIWEGIVSKFQEAGQKITDAFNQLGFNFQDITDVLWAAWSGFCDLLAPVFEAAFSIIGSVLGGVVDIITGVIEVITGIIKGFKDGDWSLLWQGCQDIVMGVVNAIGGIFDSLGEMVWNIIQTIANWFGADWNMTWDEAKQAVVDLFNNVVEWLISLPETIAEFFTNLWTQVSTFFAELPGKLVEFFTGIGEQISTWFTDMVTKAGEFATNFVNSIVTFFQELPYNIGYVIGYVLASVVQWVVDMVTQAQQMGQNFLDAVVTFFTELPGNIQNFVTNAWNNVKTWVTNMVNSAQQMGQNFIDNVVNFFQQLPGNIQNFVTNAWNNVKTWASNMISSASQTGQQFLSNVVSFFQQLPGNLWNLLQQAINNAVNFASQFGQKATQAGQWFLNNIVNAVSSIPSRVLSIGQDIVQGVWNGISSAASWFYNSVNDFFSGIVDGVKSVLGIGSPSKVMAKEVGKWLPPGVTKGWEETEGKMYSDIESDLNDGLASMNVNDIEVGAKAKLGSGQLSDDVEKSTSSLGDLLAFIQDNVLNPVSEMLTKISGLKSWLLSDSIDVNTSSWFDYDKFALACRNVLRDNPLPSPVYNVQEGDIIMDKERVGRKLAPVISRVTALEES